MSELGLGPNRSSRENLHQIPVKHAAAITLSTVLNVLKRCSPQLKFTTHCLLSRGSQCDAFSRIIIHMLVPTQLGVNTYRPKQV
jgi:hypothetical protein